jgi:quinoprotein relay system zinc metallohydrolase 2
MLELLIEVCLADRPTFCTTRLLPGPCEEARAAEWVAARPGILLVGTDCGMVAPLPVVEIAPGVFVHQGRHELTSAENSGDLANIGFVLGESMVAVIDAGGSRAVGEALYAAIRARTELPIGWLVLTHMHPDHVFGASVFREAGAAVIGHSNLPPALAARADSYRASLDREAGPLVALGSEIVAPDRTVAGSLEIDLGGRSLLLESHPTAHTDNDLTALDRATGTWWMGDLVFDGHLPSIDGSVLGWMALLDDLGARDVARVIPGHGRPGLVWPDAAVPMRDYFGALVAETRAAIARGDSLGTAAETVGQDLRGDWELFDAFHGRNVTAAYRELEWE